LTKWSLCSGKPHRLSFPGEGLPYGSIHADALMSLPKTALTHNIGRLSDEKVAALRRALLIVLDLDADY
jgi:mRNA-degrading endonuclease toxin of MazEF toxin-antitoxin module